MRKLNVTLLAVTAMGAIALFGSASYGARLGNMALPRQLLAAIAPFALAWLIENVGATRALFALAGVAVLGLAAFLEVARIRRRLTPSADGLALIRS